MEKIQNPWIMDKKNVLKTLNTDSENGLSDNEVTARKEKFGENKIYEEKHISFIAVLLEEILEPMILLLLAVGVLYSIFGDIGDAITIFVIISILVFVEIFNEYRAKKTIESLKKLSTPKTLVLRKGTYQEIDPKDLVPGDILILKVGDRIPADSRIIESYGLQIDESVLTGESTPVVKEGNTTVKESADILERKNMVFAGTTITRGKGNSIVTSIGKDTEIGHISELTEAIEEEKTPLQKAMRQLSIYLVFVALFFCVLIPVIGILQGRDLIEMILIGLSLSFATIPEELPIIIMVVLALGAYKLSNKNALVKTLNTAETLGSVNVIATDKTGTLTENRMQLRKIYANEALVTLNGNDLNLAHKKLLKIGAIANDVLLNEEGEEKYLGDPMEVAIVKSAGDHGIVREELLDEYELKEDFTFDNERKMMSQIFQKNNQAILYAKGAAEQILAISSKFFKNDEEKDLSRDLKDHILSVVEEMAKKGLRVIGFAYRDLQNISIEQQESEKNLTFVGLAGFIDPPRKEAKDSIQACQNAGIEVLMVTGDYESTARSIANEVGIPVQKVFIGKDIEAMSDEKLEQEVSKSNVYARTSPEHKLRIVSALKNNGKIVAVTGDGINDAPALKKADIGVAMGTGTEVAQEAADMVLLDDNFATITAAVEQGRKLYDNLKKGVRYYLSVKLALIIIFLLPILFNIPLPFSPIQIILLELFMDLAASAAFVIEPSESDVMKRSPRSSGEKFMDLGMISGIILGGASLIGAVLTVYFLTYFSGIEQAQTIAFTTWMIGHIFLALNMRTEKDPLYKIGILSNKMVILWAIAVVITMFFILYIPPLQAVFRVGPLEPQHWLLVILISFIATFWIEALKIYRNQTK